MSTPSLSTAEARVGRAISALGSALARGPQRQVLVPEPTIAIGDLLIVATHKRRNMTRVRVFASEDPAEHWRVEIAKNDWDNEVCGPLLPDYAEREVADIYFDAVEPYGETFTTTSHELEP